MLPGIRIRSVTVSTEYIYKSKLVAHRQGDRRWYGGGTSAGPGVIGRYGPIRGPGPAGARGPVR
eukprot:316417-Hanusia_phi.AAC.2